MRIVCCAKKTSLSPYVERCTDEQIIFTIGACRCRLSTPIVAAHDVFYFHWEEEAGQVLNVIVDTHHRMEFESCPERDLLQTIAAPEHRPRWICAPEQGHIWAEPQPDLLAGL